MNKRKHSISFIIQVTLSLIGVLVILIPIFTSQFSWPVIARDYLNYNGFLETGASNLVSAIYLGYRAFDTLGETIVLLVAVSGTISMISHTGSSLAPGFGDEITDNSTKNQSINLKRTELVDVVTGKLGPIVLLFGFYVMLYGHLSPGGGFQGGVVIASGIVFISLGSKKDSTMKLQEASVLSKIEAIGFLLLLLASISGIFVKSGFFGNPILNTSLPNVGFIIILNIIIGLKVGAGIGFMCVAMLGRNND